MTDLFGHVSICLRRIDSSGVLLDRAVEVCDGIFDDAIWERMLRRVVGGAPGSGRRNRLR